MTKATPEKIFAFHLGLIGLLGLAFACIVLADQLGHTKLWGFSRLFRLNYEDSVPTLFSALSLLVAAMAAYAVRNALPPGDRERRGWTIFAGIFAFMGADESIQIHEIIQRPHMLDAYDQYFHYFGVFPYLLVALWLAVTLFPFWLRQRAGVRSGLAAAGILYVLTAIGMELVENRLANAHLPKIHPRMAFNYTLEELGEMLAVAVFLKAFLTRYVELGGGYLLSLKVVAKTSEIVPSRQRRSDAFSLGHRR